jgi:hypothetical protein
MMSGGRKKPMRLKAVEALWKLSSLRGVIASDPRGRAPFRCKIFRSIDAVPDERIEIMNVSSASSCSRFVTYEFSK